MVGSWFGSLTSQTEIGLELIQTHMTKKAIAVGKKWVCMRRAKGQPDPILTMKYDITWRYCGELGAVLTGQ
jgi:hypothetical protein